MKYGMKLDTQFIKALDLKFIINFNNVLRIVIYYMT